MINFSLPVYFFWLLALLAAGLAYLALSCWWQEQRVEGGDKEALEDAIKQIHALQQSHEKVLAVHLARRSGHTVSSSEKTISRLLSQGWVQGSLPDGIRLTPRGAQRARELVRAHRLWERYLADTKGIPADQLHEAAEKQEHHITPEIAAQLDEELGYPLLDPHGDVIPGPGEDALDSIGQPLDQWPLRQAGQIVHVEDEPPALFAQLFAMGFMPGSEVVVQAKNDGRLLVVRNGDRQVLAPAAAANIFVVPTKQKGVPLSHLHVGEDGVVISVAGGTTRSQRRLLDMGIVPGAQIHVMRTAPLGDPVEYRVKGSHISLRSNQAATILVEPQSVTSAIPE